MSKMIAHIKRLWAAAPLATALLALALAASLFFGARAAVFWIDRPSIAERQQPIAGWMTPRYVARSWRVPRGVILGAIGQVEPLPDGPTSLNAIAEMRDMPVDQIIADLETAIAAHQAEQPPKRKSSDEGGDQ